MPPSVTQLEKLQHTILCLEERLLRSALMLMTRGLFTVCAARCTSNLSVAPPTRLLCNIQLTECPRTQSVWLSRGPFARSTV